MTATGKSGGKMNEQACPVPDHGLLTACVWDGVPDGYVDLTFRVRDTGHFLDGGTTARVVIGIKEGAGMSTVEEAARIVGKTMSRWDMEGRPDIPGGIDTHITQALADAGLLTPDLPSPYKPRAWHAGIADVRRINPREEEGEKLGILVLHSNGRIYCSKEQASSLAYALLAAADYAEGQP